CGREDEMNVIGHEAICPDLRPRARGAFRKQPAVEAKIARREADLFARMSALRDVMRNAGNNDAGKTWQELLPQKGMCRGQFTLLPPARPRQRHRLSAAKK